MKLIELYWAIVFALRDHFEDVAPTGAIAKWLRRLEHQDLYHVGGSWNNTDSVDKLNPWQTSSEDFSIN